MDIAAQNDTTVDFSRLRQNDVKRELQKKLKRERMLERKRITSQADEQLRRAQRREEEEEKAREQRFEALDEERQLNMAAGWQHQRVQHSCRRYAAKIRHMWPNMVVKRSAGGKRRAHQLNTARSATAAQSRRQAGPAASQAETQGG